MASIETKIWKGLKTRVTSLNVGYPIAMPADPDFEKPTNTNGPLPYIEVGNLLNTNARIGIKSDMPQDRAGILQLTLMYPVAMKAAYEVMIEKAGLIAAHFPTDMRLPFQGVTPRIERAPDVATPFREDAYWQIVVSVRWRCFA